MGQHDTAEYRYERDTTKGFKYGMWPSLEGRRTLSRMSMFHRVVYGSVDIEKESYLVPMTRTSRNGNSK